MSKRIKRNEVEDLAPAVPEVFAEAEEASEKPKIPFAHWFEKQLRKSKVRSYQDEALLVYFAKQGLKAAEEEKVYDLAFSKF